MTLNKIDVFEFKNSLSVNVLAAQGDKFYIVRKYKFDNRRRIAEKEKRHYVAIKNLN